MPNQVHGAFNSRHVRLRALPRCEPNSIDCEYSRPFRHIQYNRTPSSAPMATLAMLFPGASPGAHTDAASADHSAPRSAPSFRAFGRQATKVYSD
jgi:hypothetical protein